MKLRREVLRIYMESEQKSSPMEVSEENNPKKV